MKPSKMKDHIERMHPDKKNEDLKYFKLLKQKFINRANLNTFFMAPAQAYNEGGLKASFNNLAYYCKKRKTAYHWRGYYNTSN